MWIITVVTDALTQHRVCVTSVFDGGDACKYQARSRAAKLYVPLYNNV